MSIDERTRRYSAYTSGANALRIGLFDDDIDEELNPELGRERVRRRADVDGGRYPRRRTATSAPGTRTVPVTRRTPVPRPRRGATAAATHAVPTAPVGPALRLPRAPFVLLLVGIIVVGAVGVLVLNTKINENSFRLGDLKQTQAALSLQEQQLEQQLAVLSDPGNLRAAATRLGLVPAGTPAYISLPDGRVVGVPQPATDTQTEER